LRNAASALSYTKKRRSCIIPNEREPKACAVDWGIAARIFHLGWPAVITLRNDDRLKSDWTEKRAGLRLVARQGPTEGTAGWRLRRRMPFLRMLRRPSRTSGFQGIEPCTLYRPTRRPYKAKDHTPLLWNGTTPCLKSPSCGLSVKERFGVCSRMNRASSAGEAPSAVSKEDTRRCASPRQSCYGYIVSYAL
jgi:hypothetical protein